MFIKYSTIYVVKEGEGKVKEEYSTGEGRMKERIFNF